MFDIVVDEKMPAELRFGDGVLTDKIHNKRMIWILAVLIAATGAFRGRGMMLDMI